MPTQSDIAAQIAAFSHAPIPYIAEAIVVATLVWILSRSINKGAVDALRERLNLAIDRFTAANTEAEGVRRDLEALRRLVPVILANPEAEAVTASAQSGIRDLITANDRAIAFLRGDTPVTSGSFGGPAAKPDARR